MSDLQSGDYQHFLTTLKAQIQLAQQRASLVVNQELLKLYWNIGHDILQRQQQLGWGSKVIEQLAADLRHAFPELKGFSSRNLKYMRAFQQFRAILSAAVNQHCKPMRKIILPAKSMIKVDVFLASLT